MAHRMHRRRFLWYLTAGAGAAVAGSALVQITSAPADPPLRRAPNGDLLETVPQGHLPSFAQQASPKVQEVYRYAVDHGETLQYIPCFCGCARFGHKSNRDCYIKSFNTDGTLTFTSHAAT